MGIFLIVLILLFLCWPMIKRWMARFMANRAEDFIRNAAGMPPRPGSRKARQQARHAANSSGSDNGGYAYGGTRSSSRRRSGPRGRQNGPIIPKEYAEDVEFVETIDYSETEIRTDGKPGRASSSSYQESQVSDAEWEEIKN